MGVSFVARKCTQCAGRLQYIKEKKLWKCLYCGAEIERQEQYDGLFTIKNVVRQCLLDTAFRRLDSAAKNLVECEKIDSRYVGTLIAKITHEMISVITPGACSERDVRNLFAQLKKNYELLRGISPTVTEEEEVLYEFLEEPDIFATLVLVYDSLNDSARRDYVLQMLDAKQVYSKDANGNLLTYALKNGRHDLADDVLSNTNNINVSMALSEVLQKYPDGDKKREHIADLIKTHALAHEDCAVIEKYLTSPSDSIDTKATVINAAVANGMDVSLEFVVRNILPVAGNENTLSILDAYCSKKLVDDDVFRILNFACTCKDSKTAVGALDCLKRSNQYVLVPSKTVIAMLSERDLTASDKISILDKLFEFKVEAKSVEAVMTNYLCFNQDPVAARKEVILYLLDKSPQLPTSTVQNYVLKCAVDGNEKPAIVKAIFDKGLNTSFFNELLSKYMNSSTDSNEVKAEITDILSGGGLKIDPSSFIEYICGTQADVPTKIQFIKKMNANGSQLRSDAASTYLERTAPNQFSSELFSLIFTPASSFSAKAVERYLLYCRDREAIKAQNFRTIAERCSGGIGTMTCQVSHAGDSISCNILQAYVLLSDDSQGVTQDIVGWLVAQQKMKINAEITVSGKSMKFKKYVVANKDKLSNTANLICEQYKVYSMLF